MEGLALCWISNFSFWLICLDASNELSSLGVALVTVGERTFYAYEVKKVKEVKYRSEMGES